jgi:hypothetical protein
MGVPPPPPPLDRASQRDAVGGVIFICLGIAVGGLAALVLLGYSISGSHDLGQIISTEVVLGCVTLVLLFFGIRAVRRPPID